MKRGSGLRIEPALFNWMENPAAGSDGAKPTSMSGTMPELVAAKRLPSLIVTMATPTAATELMRRNSRRGMAADTAFAFIRLSIWIFVCAGHPRGAEGLDGGDTSTGSAALRDEGHRQTAAAVAGPSTSAVAPPFAAP